MIFVIITTPNLISNYPNLVVGSTHSEIRHAGWAGQNEKNPGRRSEPAPVVRPTSRLATRDTEHEPKVYDIYHYPLLHFCAIMKHADNFTSSQTKPLNLSKSLLNLLTQQQ